MARIIGEVRPRYAFVENSPLLVGRGLAVVLGDFAEMGYDARWCVLGAFHAGSYHKRERLWLLANNTNGDRLQKNEFIKPLLAETLVRHPQKSPWNITGTVGMGTKEGLLDTIVLRNNDGLANGMDRFKAIGNGQVPAVAALAWRILSDGII